VYSNHKLTLWIRTRIRTAGTRPYDRLFMVPSRYAIKSVAERILTVVRAKQ